jgi:GNAT superfamily N-acetyltransferase
LTGPLYAAQKQSLVASFAAMTGADPAAFSSEALTITVRPEPSAFPFAAMAVGFGTGTVLCVQRGYHDWAREQPIDRHEFAGYAMTALAREAKRRGEALNPLLPMMGWALGAPPPDRPAPAGYRIERVDAGWMKEWQARGEFDNALGTPEQAHRTIRNRFAYLAFDEHGEPAAIGGAFDSVDKLEVGVDVRPAHRGRGLATVVVTATARAIVDEGATPYYGCAVTNIRSQRTAIASGFLPVCSVAYAMPAGVGLK